METRTLLEITPANNGQKRQKTTNFTNEPSTTVSDHQLSPIEEQLALAMDELKLPYESQFQIDSMRCDFVFPGPRLVIECDGYDFHHTRDQRNSDTRRDRKLQMRGFQVMRFTGSDIYADPITCALQIRYMLEQISARRETASIYNDFYWCPDCKSHYAPDDVKPRTCPDCGNQFSLALNE